MLGKILLTVLVIAAAVLFARARASATVHRTNDETAKEASRIPTRTLAYIVAFSLIGGAVLFYFQHWRDWHEVVDVRVVNTQSGQTAQYRVLKGTIQERSFKTVDGWKVTVSALERLEMSPGE